jgi:hypothetical protein
MPDYCIESGILSRIAGTVPLSVTELHCPFKRNRLEISDDCIKSGILSRIAGTVALSLIELHCPFKRKRREIDD